MSNESSQSPLISDEALMAAGNEFFIRNVGSPKLWITRADALRRAYQELRTRISTDKSFLSDLRVYLMLAGYAVETYAKATVVQRTGVVTPKKKRSGNTADAEIKWPCNGHDCEKLVELSGITIVQDDNRLLATLREHILWLGRYPTPKDYDAKKFLKAVPRESNPNPEPVHNAGYYFGKDCKRIDEICDLLRTMALATLKGPEKSG